MFGPHSLGTLIEWKPPEKTRRSHARTEARRPHSLGTLIEWKPPCLSRIFRSSVERPHSLGTLIEWKLA